MQWNGVSVKFQSWNLCFRGRWIQQCTYRDCLTLTTNRKWKLAFSRPEVVITMQWNGLSLKFQRWNPGFRGRRVQWSYCQHCLTLITNRKCKLAFSWPEVVITMVWNGLSVKFQRWNPGFRDRRVQRSYCQHCLTLITNRKCKLAFSWPEVVITTQWNGISVKFHRWNPCFWCRWMKSDCANMEFHK